MSSRIGIFGGTFDPVHSGHRFLAEEAYKAGELDMLIIVPAKIPPHKNASGLTTGEQRIEMCRLAFSDMENTVVSDHELMREGKSYSYNTVKHFREQYPDDELFFIMGSDQLLTFDKWYRFRDILDMCSIIALSRDDDIDAAELRASAEKICGGSKIVIAEVRPFEISSTDIRNGIRSGADCSEYLAPEVFDYIRKNNLYRFEA